MRTGLPGIAGKKLPGGVTIMPVRLPNARRIAAGS